MAPLGSTRESGFRQLADPKKKQRIEENDLTQGYKKAKTTTYKQKQDFVFLHWRKGSHRHPVTTVGPLPKKT